MAQDASTSDGYEGSALRHPPAPTMPELISWAVGRFGDREFLRFGDHSITFNETGEFTNGLANLLAARGIEKGDRVGLILGNVPEWPLGWLAILKLGAIAVPINARYRSADLKYVLNDAGVSLVITDADRLELVSSVRSDCPTLQEILTVQDVERSIDAAPSEFVTRELAPGDLANLQYTSGTTGFPKACMLSHDYWVRIGTQAAGMAQLRDDDVVMTAQPFSYIDPQWNTVMCLMGGVPLVVEPRFSASGFWPAARAHGVSLFYVLGTMPLLLLKQPPSEEDLRNRVRLVLCSGIVPGLHRELEERWGAPWREVYGLTESGMDLYVPLECAETVGTGAIGKPLWSKEVEILREDGAPAERGERGQIVVRGRPMMLGYWNRPDETAEKLRDGWLHTGDLGYQDSDGWFHIVGRLKDMVRRGGENISCAEVEGVLGQHPDVVQCALVPVPDPLFGEEPKIFVRLRDESATKDSETAGELIEFARERLAGFKVPRYVEFVDQFPMTPSERIAKPKLLESKSDQRKDSYDAQTKSWG